MWTMTALSIGAASGVWGRERESLRLCRSSPCAAVGGRVVRRGAGEFIVGACRQRAAWSASSGKFAGCGVLAPCCGVGCWQHGDPYRQGIVITVFALQLSAAQTTFLSFFLSLEDVHLFLDTYLQAARGRAAHGTYLRMNRPFEPVSDRSRVPAL